MLQGPHRKQSPSRERDFCKEMARVLVEMRKWDMGCLQVITVEDYDIPQAEGKRNSFFYLQLWQEIWREARRSFIVE